MKNIATFLASTAVGTLVSLAPATAAVLVEPILSSPDSSLPSYNFPIGVNPPRQIVVWNAPDISGQQNFLNEGSGLDINQIELFLFPDFDAVEEDVIWGDVDGDEKIGGSDIFSNIKVDNNYILDIDGFLARAPRISFSGGVIPLGTRFIAKTLTLPDLTIPPEQGDNGPLLVGGRYDGTKVPEPSMLIGLVFALGLGVMVNKKSAQKTAVKERVGV